MPKVREQTVVSDSPLNVVEVAAILGCSPRTVWRMVERREIIAPRRIGRRIVRWSKTELQSWIEAGCPAEKQNA